MRTHVIVTAAVAALVLGSVPAAAAQPTATTGMLHHATFEPDTSGWYAEKGARLVPGPGRASAGGALLSALEQGPVVLNDVDWSVPSTVARDTYTVSVHVRRHVPAGACGPAAPTAGGEPLTLVLKEFSGDRLVKTSTADATLPAGEGWVSLTAQHVAATDGGRVGIAVGASSLAAGQSILVDDIRLVRTAAPAVTPSRPAWTPVYRNDFVDMRDVNAFQSSSAVNGGLKGTDSDNSSLQKPTLRTNTAVTADAGTTDGKALGIYTRRGTYTTPTGPRTGWTNGRMMINGQEHEAPVRITTRLRMTASAKAKSAVMWWPAGGGWPWEVDFAETFGGSTTSDYWGSRQNVGQRWHADLNGDGAAKEQLVHDDVVDATKYHVYDLVILEDRMYVEIDGRKTFETTDRRYLPRGKGFFSVGKALTHTRDASGRTDDAVLVDWLQISKPTR